MKYWKHKNNGTIIEREDRFVMLHTVWEEVSMEDPFGGTPSTEDLEQINENNKNSDKIDEVLDINTIEFDEDEELIDGKDDGNVSRETSLINLLSEDIISLDNANSDLLSFKTYENYSEVCAHADKELPAFVDGVEYKHDGSRWRKQ